MNDLRVVPDDLQMVWNAEYKTPQLNIRFATVPFADLYVGLWNDLQMQNIIM